MNNLEWLLRVKFCFRAGVAGSDHATLEDNCVKTSKDRHILSAPQIFGSEYSLGFSRKEASTDSGIAKDSGSRVGNAHLTFSWLSKTTA